MPPGWIVEALDEVEGGHASLTVGSEAGGGRAVRTRGGEEALAHSVVCLICLDGFKFWDSD